MKPQFAAKMHVSALVTSDEGNSAHRPQDRAERRFDKWPVTSAHPRVGSLGSMSDSRDKWPLAGTGLRHDKWPVTKSDLRHDKWPLQQDKWPVAKSDLRHDKWPLQQDKWPLAEAARSDKWPGPRTDKWPLEATGSRRDKWPLS